jgi:hypothetical protein
VEVDLMKDEAKGQLQKIISDYDEKLAETERVNAASRAAHAAFPARFASLRTETIHPAAQEVADMLNARGLKATVREQEESSGGEGGGGGIKPAAISLRIIPKAFAHRAAETNPATIEITFSANRGERKVAVSSTNTLINNGGTVGKLGEYEIDAVTADVVTGHVIQTLSGAFK